MKNSPERISSRLDIEEKCPLILKTQEWKLSKMKHQRGGKKDLKNRTIASGKISNNLTFVYGSPRKRRDRQKKYLKKEPTFFKFD